MQKIYIRLIFLLTLLASGPIFAQSVIQNSGVPEEIRNDFELRFNGASKVVWMKDSPQYYGARFKFQGQKMQTVYSAVDRRWVQTVEPVTYEAFPDSAQRFIAGQYPGYHQKNTKKVSTRNYGILYEVNLQKDLKGVELAFDMHGKLVREDKIVYEPGQGEELSEEQKKPKGLKARLKGLGNRSIDSTENLP